MAKKKPLTNFYKNIKLMQSLTFLEFFDFV